MAHDIEAILDVVGALHAGVADPDQWTRGLDGVGAMLGGPSMLFGSAELATQTFAISGHRIPQSAVDLIAGPLANPKSNPYIAAMPRLPLRRPVGADDLGGEQVLRDSVLWREIMAPFDLPWTLGSVLERAPERTDFVMLGRASAGGGFVPEEIDRFRLLIPHLARAARVRRELNAAHALAADMMTVLDKLERGVVLVGDTGQVRFANRAAEAIFGDGDGLDASGAGVRAARSRDTSAIQAIVHNATLTGVGRAGVAVDALAVARPSGRAAYSVVAEPLAPEHGERIGAPGGAGAVLFIGDSERSGAPSPARLEVVYGLSPAEAVVASKISGGMTPQAIAQAHGVSEKTVRTQLKAVFGKIGVNRQAQLAARVAADLGGLA